MQLAVTGMKYRACMNLFQHELSPAALVNSREMHYIAVYTLDKSASVFPVSQMHNHFVWHRLHLPGVSMQVYRYLCSMLKKCTLQRENTNSEVLRVYQSLNNTSQKC